MIWSSREYKSGTKWCFWRWSKVPTNYILRLHVIKTNFKRGLGAICLHWLNTPDPEPYLHDHPVTFLSIVLRGGYTELRNNKLIKHRWFNFIRASINDAHSIVSVKPKTLTLCFMGPKIREWGYHTPEGWIYWKDYNAKKYRKQVMCNNSVA